MALSPQYSWPEPDNSSLVKNGAQDIRALGDAIDTSVWNVGYGQAGKNKIINGDFGINQRNFTTTSVDNTYGFDRFRLVLSGATGTYSAETFTLGAAPVAGYEGKNFARVAITTGADNCAIRQNIESVRTFAGQTVTVSFWAKGTNPATDGGLYADLSQYFGGGGSPSANVTTISSKFVLTANWTRYSLQINVPSIAGKTLGTDNNDSLGLRIGQAASVSADAWTLDIWGIQVEYGSKATPFQTATGTIQGELAAAQRYYYRATAGNAYSPFGYGPASSTTQGDILFNFPVTMRTTPTVIEYSTLSLQDTTGSNAAATAVTLQSASPQMTYLRTTVASGLTQFRTYVLAANNSTSAYVVVGAEL
jgi:hypothetical protein